ncbi:MAG: cell division protein FtsA [Myxococcales bacterium]|nr:cell division protein FtsA [Myxococcales bacterium]
MMQPVAVADIGYSKVCVVIGRMGAAGLDVLGFGSAESEGMRKNRSLRTDEVARCLREALEAAETMANVDVQSIVVGVTPVGQRGMNVQAELRLASHTVRETDIALVQAQARSRGISEDRVVLHMLVQEFAVDQREAIASPAGMKGRRLRVRAHLLTAGSGLVKQLQAVARQAGLRIDGVVAQPIASSLSVLEPDECREGVVLVDIGAGSTDVLVWSDGALVYSASFPGGGDTITRDIAQGLDTTMGVAARLKQASGVATWEKTGANDFIEYATRDSEVVQRRPRKVLIPIIQPRLEEIFQNVANELASRDLGAYMGRGYVLVGGTAEMPGCAELAAQVLGGPVRVGVPLLTSTYGAILRQPRYAAAVGLLRYVLAMEGKDQIFRLSTPTLFDRARTFFRTHVMHLF